MDIKRHFNEALTNLLSSKLRSFLATLGILVGTGSVVALVLSGQLATRHALKEFQSLGTDLLSITIADNPMHTNSLGNRIGIDALKIIRKSSPDIMTTAAYTSVFVPLSFQGRRLSGTLLGVNNNFESLAKLKLHAGRFILPIDHGQFQTVIGDNIAKQMREQGVFNPIGKRIQVGNNYFTIVGIAQHWPENIFLFSNLNRAAMVPLSSALLINNNASISNLLFQIHPEANPDKVSSAITTMIHSLAEDKKTFVRSAKQVMASMARQSQTFTLLLGVIGGISLLVGGIGVMNIMLVSVTERKREIGIRLAVGAKQTDIQKMFLIEAITLTLFGGVLGVVLGMLISFLIALFAGWDFYFFVLPPLIGFSVSVLVGIFFGFYPAQKAAKLDPIQTLRSVE